MCGKSFWIHAHVYSDCMSFVDQVEPDVLFQTWFYLTNQTENQEFPISLMLNLMLLLNSTEDLVKLQLWFINVKSVCEMSYHLITLPAFKKCKWNV